MQEILTKLVVDRRVMLWLRAHGIEGEVIGGSNPGKLHRPQKRHYEPVGARRARIPLERKEHNGQIERRPKNGLFAHSKQVRRSTKN